MAEVVKLELVSVGDKFRFDPDKILEAAKGQSFDIVTVIGHIENEDTYWVSSSANAGETLILLERAKRQLLE